MDAACLFPEIETGYGLVGWIYSQTLGEPLHVGGFSSFKCLMDFEFEFKVVQK
jgi:hypothetical protein